MDGRPKYSYAVRRQAATGPVIGSDHDYDLACEINASNLPTLQLGNATTYGSEELGSGFGNHTVWNTTSRWA